eukprot:5510067-Alexandrium_andersonii.AAC.1
MLQGRALLPSLLASQARSAIAWGSMALRLHRGPRPRQGRTVSGGHRCVGCGCMVRHQLR